MWCLSSVLLLWGNHLIMNVCIAVLKPLNDNLLRFNVFSLCKCVLLLALFLAYFSSFILEDKHVQNCFRKWKRTFVMCTCSGHMLWRQSEKKVPLMSRHSRGGWRAHWTHTVLDHACLNPLWSPASLHLRGWRTFYEAYLTIMYACNALWVRRGSTLCAVLFTFLKFVFKTLLGRIFLFLPTLSYQLLYTLAVWLFMRNCGIFQNKPGSATQTHGVLFYLLKSERDKMDARLKRSRKCAVEY